MLLIALDANAIGTVADFNTTHIVVQAIVILVPIPVTSSSVGITHWFGNI